MFHSIVVLDSVADPSFAFATPLVESSILRVTPLAAPSSVVEVLSVLLGFPNIVEIAHQWPPAIGAYPRWLVLALLRLVLLLLEGLPSSFASVEAGGMQWHAFIERLLECPLLST